MAVRNFWIEVEIDGRKTRLRGGPRAANGGLSIRISQRDDGDIREVAVVDCKAFWGKLITQLCHKTEQISIETNR